MEICIAIAVTVTMDIYLNIQYFFFVKAIFLLFLLVGSISLSHTCSQWNFCWNDSRGALWLTKICYLLT